jgi:hypothetical protein
MEASDITTSSSISSSTGTSGNPIISSTQSDRSWCKWDGSYLGEFDGKVIHSYTKMTNYLKIAVVRLNINGYLFVAGLKAYSNDDPLIIDELKTIFNLKKTGTHLIRFKNMKDTIYTEISNRQYVLNYLEFKYTINNGNIDTLLYIPRPLSEYDAHFSDPKRYFQISSFDTGMKNLIIFMHICGIAYQSNNIFLEVLPNGSTMPKLFYTKTVTEDKQITALSNINIKRWFPVIDFNKKEDIIADAIIRMLNIRDKDGRITEERINISISNFRDKFTEILTRFPNTNIMKFWYIVDYVNNKLYDIPVNS